MKREAPAKDAPAAEKSDTTDAGAEETKKKSLKEKIKEKLHKH